ncbi:hypothetical protein B0A55_08273 [Friedmanniomyces simplex]|uniref:Anaphase-promoting complex subunit 4 WD40 domain-containing protein n=1 Tax=Friedmanniomyces simplex TaxID=329884 RepID=A0A4U0WVC6_9PEZI|nr:hypothetical protein B0A55_08273 [Friedmanniomyces simplex]
MGNRVLTTECVATTGITFCKNTIDLTNDDDEAPTRRNGGRGRPESNFFREAQFSPDGTTVVTHNEDQCLRTFVLPPELLDDKTAPIVLREYAKFTAPSNIQSYAVHPFFDLQDPTTTLVLHSSTDHPLALRNVLDYATAHAKYNLISPTTERYLTTNSLLFTRDGSHFVTGGHNQLSMFDCSRNYSGPLATHQLVPGKKARKLYGAESLGCKGIVTALAVNDDGLLVAGTTEREVGLYADGGGGECVVAFSVAAPPSEKHVVTGSGVMHLRWTPDGKYLLAAERQSDGIQVYDVRNMVHRVAWLSGRKAGTTQKLGIEVVPASDEYARRSGVKCYVSDDDPADRGVMGITSPAGAAEDPVSDNKLAVWTVS